MSEENIIIQPGPIFSPVDEETLEDIGLPESALATEPADNEEVLEEHTVTTDKVKAGVKLTRSPMREKKEGELTPILLVIPPADIATVLKTISEMNNEELGGASQKEWLAKLKYSLDMLPSKNAFTDELANVANGGTNTLENAGKLLALSMLSPKAGAGRQVYEGERAYLQIVNHRGSGGVSKAPLWNSGFYIYFKPAVAPQFLELLAMLNSDTLTAGRDTYGLALSSDTAYTLSRLVDFALAHVYATSIASDAFSTLSELKKLIKPQDTWALLWGFLCACFKNGIEYEQPCVADPSKCNHIDKGVIDITLLQVPFKEKLTDWHISHMSKTAQNSMSLESVKRYQDELPCHQEFRVVFDQGTPRQIAISIATPTANEFIDQSTGYIDALANSITKSLAQRLTEKERNTFIEESSRATALCKYSHFISKIEFGDVNDDDNALNHYVGIVTDRDGIMRSLASLSEDTVIREKIIDEIVNYIGRSSASAIAIPAYNCPKCGGKHAPSTETDDPAMKSVIPIDVIQLFFELVSQRIQKLVA